MQYFPREDKAVARVCLAAEQLKDKRELDQTEFVSLVLFFRYGENVFSEFDRTWDGATFRQADENCLLVVKSTLDGVPQVVFTSARTPIDCVRIFMRKWFADTCEWVRDRYR